MQTRQRNGAETTEKGYQHRQATRNQEKTEAEVNLTCPKGRPRRDGKRRFERVRKTDKQKPQQHSKAEPVENELKPERRTPQQTLGGIDTKGENTAEERRKKHEAGGEKPSERKPAEMQGNNTQTTEVQSKENPQHGRQPGECQERRAAGGAGSGKPRKKARKQKETHQTEKGGEKQEGTARTAAGGKTWKKNGNKQP